MQNLISSIELLAISKQKPHTNSTPICQTSVTAQRHLNWREKRSPKRFPQILWRQSTDIPASMGAIYVDISRSPTKDPNSCTTWQRTGWDECFDMVWQTACEIFLNAPNSLGRCLHFFRWFTSVRFTKCSRGARYPKVRSAMGKLSWRSGSADLVEKSELL